MEKLNNTINRKDNKLLYFLDLGLDKFVTLFISIIRLFVPNKYKVKFDALAGHKDILHNVMGLAFFNAIGGFCVIITQIKLANYLGASIYGIYSYCLAIGEVGAVFVRYGRNKTMLRDLVQYPEKRDSLVVSTFFISIINLAIFMGVTFACHNSLDIEVNWTYFLLILSPCLISLSLEPLYESLRMMSWSAIYTLLQKFIFLAVIWILLFSQINVSLFEISIIVVTSWLLVYALEYYEIITQLRINFIAKVRFTELKNLYRENFVIFLSCVTGVAFGPLLRMILNNYTDSTSVGIYAAALQIYHMCLFLNTQIGRVGNPMMAQACRQDVPMFIRRRKVLIYLFVMLLTAMPFALPMLIFPRQITNMFFSIEYTSIANYLPILALYLIAISIGVVFMQFLISMRKDKLYFFIFITSALTTLLIAFILIQRYGVLGAILSLCVPHGIGCICYMLCSLKYLRIG